MRGGNYWWKKLFRAKICVPAPSAPTSVLTQNKGPDTEPHFSNPPPPPPSAGVHVTPPPPPRRAIFRSPCQAWGVGVSACCACLGQGRRWSGSPEPGAEQPETPWQVGSRFTTMEVLQDRSPLGTGIHPTQHNPRGDGRASFEQGGGEGGRGGGGFGPKTWCTKNGLTRFSLL